MQLINPQKGKFRLTNYVDVNKIKEVIYVTTCPFKICIVTYLCTGRAQLYDMMTNEITLSGSADFTSLQDWVSKVVEDKANERHVFVCGTQTSKFKLLMRVSNATSDNAVATALTAAEYSDVYEIVAVLPKSIELNHCTHRFITDERQRCELIYVANQGYTWMVTASQLCGSKFHLTVAAAVEEAQADLLSVYMEPRNESK